MELMVLVGVWALAFGHIALSHSKQMKGKQARIFGALLILAAAYGLPYLNGYLAPYTPDFASKNEAFRQAWGLLIGALGIHITNYVVHTVYPKMRIPSVNVSIKSKRAA